MIRMSSTTTQTDLSLNWRKAPMINCSRYYWKYRVQAWTFKGTDKRNLPVFHDVLAKKSSNTACLTCNPYYMYSLQSGTTAFVDGQLTNTAWHRNVWFLYVQNAWQINPCLLSFRDIPLGRYTHRLGILVLFAFLTCSSGSVLFALYDFTIICVVATAYGVCNR